MINKIKELEAGYSKFMDALNRLDELADNEETAEQNQKDYECLADLLKFLRDEKIIDL